MYSSLKHAFLLTIALAATATSADAARRNTASGVDTVVAESRFGNGRISAPVRPAEYGWEVRLPGGTWVGCRTSCEETLRVETVDRDERIGELSGRGTLLNECGIFGCLDLRYPR